MQSYADAQTGCYDLTIERTSEETDLRESGAPNGGESHE